LFFGDGKYKLDEGLKSSVTQCIKDELANKNIRDLAYIPVVGHADKRPLGAVLRGETGDNQMLAARHPRAPDSLGHVYEGPSTSKDDERAERCYTPTLPAVNAHFGAML
jgi:hypothetical protein